MQELKEKWGVPFSIMRFDRENHQLSRICRQITKHTECRTIKGDVTGREIPQLLRVRGPLPVPAGILRQKTRIESPRQFYGQGDQHDCWSLDGDGDARV